MCSTRLQTVKWYMVIFFFLLDTCINNAYTLWKKHLTDDPAAQKTSRRMWMMMLCEDMLVLGGGGADGGAMEASGGPPVKSTGAKGCGQVTKTLMANCLTPTHPAQLQCTSH